MKEKKEPIRYWKIWVVLFSLFILSVPWYLPAGTYEPLIFGIPYWAYIIMGVSLLISITLTYVLNHFWEMTEEEEEEEKWKI
ncbi:hypothetical protein [Virgibacillus sediminis]|uniref:DUF3311 domain-containing protein n=1 Tax=Virgibacillus sediminis TaxID=202260 RepID=A0ABV7A7I8_9BACI